MTVLSSLIHKLVACSVLTHYATQLKLSQFALQQCTLYAIIHCTGMVLYYCYSSTVQCTVGTINCYSTKQTVHILNKA